VARAVDGRGCGQPPWWRYGRSVTAPEPPSEAPQTAGIVVLVSGSGTNLQALIDAASDPAYGVRILAVGADRDGIAGLARAERAGIPTFVCRVGDHADRDAWDAALADAISAHDPVLVVSAGFMKLLGPKVLGRHTVVNTHPALLPAFPGAHAVRDALAYGARVTGCTVHVVDAGVDTGPVLAQTPVAIEEGDTEESLHERIKTVERTLLVDVVGRAAREGITVTDRKATIP
jgi:phosphoribosylglycinamide formyltransferase-1